jgi:1-aminocyclopropane-1-carboxylate synthase
MEAPKEAQETLSPRGAKACEPALSYFGAFVQCAADPWTPKHPQKGVINLCVAEDKLSADLLSAKLRAVLLSSPPLPPQQLGYQDMKGTLELRSALASTYARMLAPTVAFEPQHLSVSAGAGAVLEQLAFALASPGDCFLIPAPWYAAFRNDLGVRAGVRAWPVAEPSGSLLPSFAALSAERDRAVASGSPVRALLLVNPVNPTGIVLPPTLLRELLAWGLSQGLHCICDELYAFSVFRPEAGPPFVSAATHAWGGETAPASPRAGAPALHGADERLHLVLGLSKDFCASGLRCGVLYSRNARLHQMLDNVSYFASTPTHTQSALAAILREGAWVDAFMAERRARLLSAYTALTHGLVAAKIHYVPATAGMFLWIDARSLLPKLPPAVVGSPPPSPWAAEKELWKALYSCDGARGGVLLTPGFDCAAAEPGWFRACYAAADPACLHLVGERMREVAGALNASTPSEYVSYCAQQ